MQGEVFISEVVIDKNVEQKDYENAKKISFSICSHDLNVYCNRGETIKDPVANIAVEFGDGEDKFMYFAIQLDELELFIEHIRKNIKMFRRDNADLIKIQRDLGGVV